MRHIREFPDFTDAEVLELSDKLHTGIFHVPAPAAFAHLVKGPCWLYGGKWEDGKGYKKIKFKGVTLYVHRATHELFKGPIPAGCILDHLCRQHGCCNPDHTEPVTPKVNTERGDNPNWLLRKRAWPQNNWDAPSLMAVHIEHGHPRFRAPLAGSLPLTVPHPSSRLPDVSWRELAPGEILELAKSDLLQDLRWKRVDLPADMHLTDLPEDHVVVRKYEFGVTIPENGKVMPQPPAPDLLAEMQALGDAVDPQCVPIPGTGNWEEKLGVPVFDAVSVDDDRQSWLPTRIIGALLRFWRGESVRYRYPDPRRKVGEL